MDNHLHHYPHTSRSTAQGANGLTFEVWVWDLSTLGPSSHSLLPEKLLIHKSLGASCHCCGNLLAWNLQRDDNLPIVGPQTLYIFMVLSPNMFGTSGATWLLKHCIPGIQYKIFGLKICDCKITHGAWVIKTRKDWGRTTHEQRFTWEGAFRLRENICCSFTWPQQHAIWEDNGAKQGIKSPSSRGEQWL